MKHKFTALLLSCIFILSGCAGTDNSGTDIELLEPAEVLVNKYAVTRTDIFDAEYQEAIVTSDIHNLSFSRSGTVAYSYVQLGDYVEKGQLIARLNDYSDANRINNYESQLINLNEEQLAELERIEEEIRILTAERDRLLAGGDKISAASKDLDIEARQATLEYTKHLHVLERENLEKTLTQAQNSYYGYDLTAPCSGTIASVSGLTAGSRVRARNTVGVLIDDENLYIKGDYISETELEEYSKITALIGDKTYELTYIPLEEDVKDYLTYNNRDLYNCYSINAEPGELSQGSFAALILISNYRENALAVPPGAIYEGTEGNYVYVIKEDGSREYRLVQTGVTTESYVEITNGLQEGEYVYVQ